MMKLYVLLFIFSVAATSEVHAKDLTYYRKKFANNPQEVQSQVQGRRSQLNALLLGNQSVDVSAVREQMVQVPSVEHFSTSSSYFKRMMGFISRALKLDAERGAPAVFDPGLMPKQIDEQVQARAIRVCTETVQNRGVEKKRDEWEIMFNALYVDVVIPTGDRKKSENVESAGTLVLKQRVTESLSEVVKASRDVWDPKTQLQQIEVVDGVVTRLRFPELVDFSVLVSIRTGADPYYILAVDCAREQMRKTIEEKTPLLDKLGGKDRASQILEFLNEKHEGAARVAALLSKLNGETVDQWIHWFLNLRGADIPTHTDIEGLASWSSSLATGDAEYKQATLDYLFYSQMSDELDVLSDYLVEWRDKKGAHEKLIKAIKETGK